MLEKGLTIVKLYELFRQSRYHSLPLACSFLASIFGSFSFLATRRIGKQVHASVKTMYLGIVSLVISVVTLMFYRPSYFAFWKQQYTLPQLLITMLISAFFWLTQSSLSISLENVKAANVASFMYISVIMNYFGTMSLHSRPIDSTGKSILLAQVTKLEKIHQPELLGVLIITIGLLLLSASNYKFD